MNVNTKLTRLAAVATVALAVCAGGATSAQQPRTQWDGVYTEAQAARGESLYAESCMACHGPELTGGEGPGLTGDDFNSHWNDLALGDLFERIRVSMPANNPGSLSLQQNADILAFILHKGSFPTGATELPSETRTLNSIKFAATRPAAH
jgi:mono/diheme cytochrome c family protein